MPGMFNDFLASHLEGISSWLLSFTHRPGPPFRENTIRARCAQATRFVRKQGGIVKSALILVSAAPSPRNNGTLNVLRDKHSFEDPHEIPDARERVAEVLQQHKPRE